MFKEERTESHFDWAMIGDINLGRPNLGSLMDVAVYRLMQFTLRDIMIIEFGVKKTDEIFYLAGKKAGMEIYKNLITKKDSFEEFIDNLQEILRELKIGILRIEKADFESLEFTITVAEDLDCSGLPITDEEICVYDEGFISGLLLAHTGSDFNVKEVDCWCSGDRVCRFQAKVT
ncbi:MAG: 4-vinyl reductase [Bacteroidales bacterium]|nr:4-vinyl reductase [Bacteroidales bacterium]